MLIVSAAQLLGEHDVVIIMLSLALMLGMARLLGELCRRLGQPPVIGELIAGIILGQSVLGVLRPDLFQFLFPSGEQADSRGAALFLEGLIGLSAVLLLMVAGLEVELKTVWRQGKAALLVGLVGMLIPGAIAYAIAWNMPHWFMPEHSPFTPPVASVALFVGIALSITALPVIAKILIDLNMMKSDIGMLIMSGAMLNDLLGWLGFAVVMALIASSQNIAGTASAHGDVGVVMLRTLLFLGLTMTVVRVGFHRLMPWIQAHLTWPGGVLAVVLMLTLTGAAATEAIGIHAVFGAFIAGVVIGDSHHLRQRTRDTIHQFITNVFAPIFFVGVGLHVNIWDDFNLGLVLLCTVIACAGKIGGCYLGAKWAKMHHRESLAVGFGMAAQGTMGLILGRLALQSHIISNQMFVAIIFVALFSSILSGPAMRLALQMRAKLNLGDLIPEKHLIQSLQATSVQQGIEEMADRAAQITQLDAAVIGQAVWQREQIMSTGLGHQLAVPHARLQGITKPTIIIAHSPLGLDFDAPDGKLARLICLLLTDKEDQRSQVELLSLVASTFHHQATRQAAINAQNHVEFLAALKLAEHD